MLFFFFKQKTAYEMRISDWSSDVCSSDLSREVGCRADPFRHAPSARPGRNGRDLADAKRQPLRHGLRPRRAAAVPQARNRRAKQCGDGRPCRNPPTAKGRRSSETPRVRKEWVSTSVSRGRPCKTKKKT